MQGKTDANVPQNSLTQEGSLPFFTRFLEGQNENNPQTAGGVMQAGSDGNLDQSLMTLKYPSDRDEDDFR
ncbi:MAG: microviridin/marinostatin family tricyclic proteinase inhibitor [Pyrinomonadaceae bacterium]